MGAIFFEKNKIDLDLGSQVTITVTDATASNTGQDSVDYLRNRNNESGWGTSDSNDAALTQLDIAFGEQHDIDTLFFLRNNWKAYTCQYALGAGALTDFSTAINVSGNSQADKYHTFDTVTADRLRIIISQTFVADDDKFCSQIIVTERIGSFSTIKPNLDDVEFGRNRKLIKTISGKARVQRNTGNVAFSLKKNNVTDPTDLSLVETLHDYHNGFLVWPNGNADVTESAANAAILNARIFWRRRDLFLMSVASELAPGWGRGRYAEGQNIDMKLVEVL